MKITYALIYNTYNFFYDFSFIICFYKRGADIKFLDRSRGLSKVNSDGQDDVGKFVSPITFRYLSHLFISPFIFLKNCSVLSYAKCFRNAADYGSPSFILSLSCHPFIKISPGRFPLCFACLHRYVSVKFSNFPHYMSDTFQLSLSDSQHQSTYILLKTFTQLTYSVHGILSNRLNETDFITGLKSDGLNNNYFLLVLIA